jgi:hypothetical protein
MAYRRQENRCRSHQAVGADEAPQDAAVDREQRNPRHCFVMWLICEADGIGGRIR